MLAARVASKLTLIAAGAFALAAISAQPLTAQEYAEWKSAAELPTTADPVSPYLGLARHLLRTLVGTWRFEIRFAGNVDGAPDASGTHVVTALFDDLRVEWFEVLDHCGIQGRGIIGFDPGTDRFYSVAIYSAGYALEFMWGTMDSTEPLITFRPSSFAPSDSLPVLDSSAALQTLDQDHFTWVALNRGWRAVFTRQH